MTEREIGILLDAMKRLADEIAALHEYLDKFVKKHDFRFENQTFSHER